MFAFLLVTGFDTIGATISVAEQAGLMIRNTLPEANRAVLSNSFATATGAIFGTSPTIAFTWIYLLAHFKNRKRKVV